METNSLRHDTSCYLPLVFQSLYQAYPQACRLEWSEVGRPAICCQNSRMASSGLLDVQAIVLVGYF